ncbi:SUMO protease [Klebsormidium nitens]|uniref:SUMO protease n=1 Tax=Klebsormidium nitens TaxID=105231 RepID=A0A1Y1IJH9_KLENI|nr:SUMO protease [Klebsormidium nitens]|eukprot:GAQ88288.1 SUMO protease [Klebsormidium nitens]
MALLSRLSVAPDSLGKRKRELDTRFNSPLKKLASNAAIRSALTTFPASPYLNQIAKNSPSSGLASALQLSNRVLPSTSFAPRPLRSVFQQPSPIFYPESIPSALRAPPEVSTTAVTVRAPSGPRHANGDLDLGRLGGGKVSAEAYKTARLQAQVRQLQERLHMVHEEVVHLQNHVRGSQEKKQSWYGDILRKVRESADLRRQVTGVHTEASAERGKSKMSEREDAEGTSHGLSEARETAEDRGEAEGGAGGGAERPSKSLSGAAEVASVSTFLQRLRDLRLDDHKQRSRDLEIQLKEAELAVQKQQRLRDEEEVEEEEEVTEELEEEEEVTEEVTDEEEEETDEEVEEEGYVAVPLTEEDDELVDEILHNPPSDEVCVAHERSSLQITQAQMQCLRPDMWLNDEVINLYMVLLKERESREDFQEEGLHPVCHFFNTFFYNKLRMDAQEYEYSRVQRWTRRVKYKLAKCDKVIVPIHQGIHWALAVINLRDRRLEYFDSVCDGAGFPFSTRASPETVLEDLAQYIMDEAEDKGTGPIDTSDWERVYHTDKPQQGNNSDCGMFMLKFADFVSRDAPITFSQKEMWYFRRKLVVELVHKRAD